MKITKQIDTADDMLALGEQLAQQVGRGAIIYLRGELGAGKTTFTRGFLQGFGYTGKVKSPTYTLVEPYELSHHSIFHFDLYRLRDAAELEFIGIQEYFAPSAICLVEWPEKGYPVLPSPDLACYIEFVDSGRLVVLESHTALGADIIQKMQ